MIARMNLGRIAFGAALFAASTTLSSTVSAKVTEEYSVSTVFGYLTNSKDPVVQVETGVDKGSVFLGSTDGIFQSELGIDYTATAGDGSFFFLHQNYCAGTCSTFSQSIISITLNNTGLEPVSLRFDSQITPGHLSVMSPSGGMDAQFSFVVDQKVSSDEFQALYTATGAIIPDGPFLDTGGLAFNGLEYTNPPMSNWAVIDWGATNLSVPLLTLDAGATTVLRYRASYYVRNDGQCDTLDTCSSAEIVFGDPRNNGSVPLSSLAMLNESDPVGKPLVGGVYTPYRVPFRIVPLTTPLPEDPEPKTPVTYTPVFASRANAVPEPATWAMMVLGFAASGFAARRRPIVTGQVQG